MNDRDQVGRSQNTRKRVLVIQSDRIMGDVLISLITRQDNLDVVSRSISTPLDLIEEVSCIKPDVIILDDQGQFACHTDLQVLLETIPDLKIVVLNSNNNHVEVFSKSEVFINTAKEFFEIL
jgi:DNA-binding NarL/FixJ family response regulator